MGQPIPKQPIPDHACSKDKPDVRKALVVSPVQKIEKKKKKKKMEKKVEEEETQVINLCDSQKHCTLDFM
jgi:hypothetical protein